MRMTIATSCAGRCHEIDAPSQLSQKSQPARGPGAVPARQPGHLGPVPRRAYAAGEAPRRLILVFTGNGTVESQFWPTGGEKDFTFGAGSIADPIAAFRLRAWSSHAGCAA